MINVEDLVDVEAANINEDDWKLYKVFKPMKIFGKQLESLFDIGIGLAEPTIQKTINDMTQGQADNYIDTKLKHYAFGLGFSYDFAPLNFMTVGLDIGFSVGQIKMDKYDIAFSTIPWSLNVKFFFASNLNKYACVLLSLYVLPIQFHTCGRSSLSVVLPSSRKICVLMFS